MGKTYLGLELGSTRIKAVAIDEAFQTVSSGGYTWASAYTDGIWTYPLEQVWVGLRTALEAVANRENICCLGISGMMHGYLAFDRDWNLLTPFRTWQNTITAQAAQELTELFGFNVPQRWSIAHLYQAVLNGEAHVPQVAHITTLAGFVHHALTGENCLGIGEASGMFPIDSAALTYDREMLEKLRKKLLEKGIALDPEALLPKVLPAGADAGRLTEAGAALLGGLLPAGLPLAPPEGDAGTGMTATNAVAPGTGNVSAGTSIFAMVVLEKPLSRVYPEIDLVTTPSGRPVAMVHCNNCTADMNGWVSLFGQLLSLFGRDADPGELFSSLYQKSLEGAADCGGITVYNYSAGEPITGFDQGRPMVVRDPAKPLRLEDFLRAQLYSTLASLAAGMELLRREQVVITRLMGHGGLFKTPVVGQRYLAAATDSPVTVMETAGEGGPYGMALLAAYRQLHGGRSLEDFLEQQVFTSAKKVCMNPDPADTVGFRTYLARFLQGLPAERAAVDYL